MATRRGFWQNPRLWWPTVLVATGAMALVLSLLQTGSTAMLGSGDGKLVVTIGGRVTTEAGVALSNATITRATLEGEVLAVRTDANGYYMITGVTAGLYRLFASLPGHAFTPGTRRVTVSGADIYDLDFTATAVLTTVVSPTIKLPIAVSSPAPVVNSPVPGVSSPSAGSNSVSGQATTTAGVPLSKVWITRRGDCRNAVYTDANGEYVLRNLPRGTYQIIAYLTGSAFAPQTVTVADDSHLTEVNFVTDTAIPFSTQSGRVTTKDKRPLANVWVAPQGSRNGVYTDADGNYELTNLPDGRYLIEYSLNGYDTLLHPTHIPGRSRKFLANVFLIPSIPFNTISGRITTRDGTGLPNVWVARSGSKDGVFTDAEGKYQLTDLPPGTYEIEATLAGFKFHPQRVHVVNRSQTLNLNLKALP